VLGGPAQPYPLVAAELALPLPALLEALVLVARSAPPAHRRERSVEAVGEPRARIGAKAFLRGGEVQVQAAGRYQRRARKLPERPGGVAAESGKQPSWNRLVLRW